ncbi:hypothetical protein H0H92_011563 [Tricholoma furcatifolium]|nr:hypothetical protein H0H92_011563 [Tricholoma furcatifolium]
MAAFRIISLLIITLFYEPVALAAPWPIHARHATHRIRRLGRSLKVKAFHPKSTFKTFGSEGVDYTVPERLEDDLLLTPALNDTALAFESHLGINVTQVGYRSGFAQVDTNQNFAYWLISLGKVGRLLRLDLLSSILATNIASSTPTVTVDSVIPNVEQALEGSYNNYPPSLEYLNATSGTWYEAFVCAHTGSILSVTDFVAHASYHVLPIHEETLLDADEQTLTDPQDLLASPFGWHSDGITTINNTSGNNIISAVNSTLTNETSNGLVFNVSYDESLDPTVASNVAASTVNAFYVANTVHDFTYRYGFTESAFNFQAENFNNGGAARDPVLVSVQNSGGLNNANFATPPDGQFGQCNMFLWDLTSPRRDGAMENDILVHEMTHGVTNRMTGGGTGRCLQTLEAGGLGEGWSDAMADWISQKSENIQDFVMGQYVINSSAGIRTHPYSTDLNVNPLMYSNVAVLTEVHAIGEVWANMLHNVHAALVSERGFSTEALTNPNTTEGNVVFMHLFIDSLLLQPCNPSFVDARNAWIQADENRYNGANKCTLFNTFASRGLGLNANGTTFVDNTDVPAGC